MFGIVGQRKRAASLGALAGALALFAATPAHANHRDIPTKPTLAVSNNWDGTVDLVNPNTFKRQKRINVVPDLDQRLSEIFVQPDRLALFLAIRNQIGENHDQLADDAFTSPNRQFLYVSRPSLADVVAIRMRTGEIHWRVPIEGYRSDHMAISENGRKLLVSDSTERKVHEIDTERGKIVDSFPSGDSPHENNYSKDGDKIFHASIGMVYTPLDQPEFDTTKGDRYFQIVDSRTLEVRKRLNMGRILERAGYPDMSAAVRPMTLSPDERFVYFQVSFFHGFIEYDLKTDRVRRVVNLPQSEKAQNTPRENYLLDSAHHGIDMNPEGTRLRRRDHVGLRGDRVPRNHPVPHHQDGLEREAVLVDLERERPLLLRLDQRPGPRRRDRLQGARGGREHPGRRSPPADADRSRQARLPRLGPGRGRSAQTGLSRKTAIRRCAARSSY